MSAIIAVVFDNDDETSDDEQEVIDALLDVSEEFDCKSPEEVVDFVLECLSTLEDFGLEPDTELDRDELISSLYSGIEGTIGEDLISIDVDLFDEDNEKYDFSVSINQGYNVSVLLHSENVEDDSEDDDADFNEGEDGLKEFF